jgi:hypothetical protein
MLNYKRQSKSWHRAAPDTQAYQSECCYQREEYLTAVFSHLPNSTKDWLSRRPRLTPGCSAKWRRRRRKNSEEGSWMNKPEWYILQWFWYCHELVDYQVGKLAEMICCFESLGNRRRYVSFSLTISHVILSHHQRRNSSSWVRAFLRTFWAL